MATPTRHTTPVVLFTDFGARGGHYVAAMKGAILAATSGGEASVTFVDASHEVSPFSVVEADFLVEYVGSSFPAGTVLLVVVDPGVGSERDVLVGESLGGLRFVGPDNGVFTGLFRAQGVKELVRVRTPRDDPKVSSTFHGRDVMAPLAARLVKGDPPAALGKPTSVADCVLLSRNTPKVFREGDTTRAACTVRYVDGFGNVVTDLPARALGELRPSRPSEGTGTAVFVEELEVELPLLGTYSDVERGKSLALVGSYGSLEFSTNQGDFAASFGVRPGQRLHLAFRPLGGGD